ncbi:MAG: hypothetical protein CME36_16460 [unclassified Hahellaceae]|nr:hypothetical protein [Hahellaceae bacterium]|tara:strand:- start:170570 stop:170980 length:411 start_codon:yes stop_codon:yes gene_type:complete
MNSTQFNAHRDRGFGLPMALFVIVVLSFLLLSLTQLEESTAEGFSISLQSTRAFYAAESGAEIAMHQLFPPPNGKTVCTAVAATHTFSEPGLAGCSAELKCDENLVDGTLYFTVTSTGRCGAAADGAERTVVIGAH